MKITSISGVRADEKTRDIPEDKLRRAPVLRTLASGEYDSLMSAGRSVRIRETRSGYYFFTVDDAGDIPELTDDIKADGGVKRFIAVDSECENVWRGIFPDAEYRYFNMTVITPETLRPPYDDIRLPGDVRMTETDDSWDELIIGVCADEEFTPELLKRQFRENLSAGLVSDGKKIGFVSTHLNGELGSQWISPEFRGKGIGQILLYNYLNEYFKSNPIGFALCAPHNAGAKKMVLNLGFSILDRQALLITVHDRK